MRFFYQLFSRKRRYDDISVAIDEHLDAKIECRWFTREDQDPRGRKTVILSCGYWQRCFGADPRAVGAQSRLTRRRVKSLA